MVKKHVLYLLFIGLVAIALLSITNCGEENPQDPGGTNNHNLPDTVAPEAITTLDAKSPTRNSIALQWVSPGDDGDQGQAQRYDIRYLDTLITDENWDKATPVADPPTPKPGGQVELFAIKGLLSARDYYFAIKTYDEVPNESELSNCDWETTATETARPSAVTDLSAVALSDTEYLLSWTSTGDDGMVGTAYEYDVRYASTSGGVQDFESAAQVDGEPAPKPSGERDSMMVSGLTPGMDYYFAMKVADEVENWSTLSNVTFGLSMSTRLLAHPATIFVGQTPSTQIMFRVEQDGPAGITLSRLKWESYPWTWVIVKRLASDIYETGAYTVTWDLTDKDGVPCPAFYGQIQVRLHYGSGPIDSVEVRLFEP